jgi:hypothetical protein
MALVWDKRARSRRTTTSTHLHRLRLVTGRGGVSVLNNKVDLKEYDFEPHLFDYQCKLPSHEYRYLVEVSKKNAHGVDRSLIELRIAASSILLNGLSEALADVRINSPTFGNRKDQFRQNDEGASLPRHGWSDIQRD